MGVVQIRAHHDPAAFRVLVTPLLAADRVRHTVFLTVLAALCRAPADGAVLLSVHDGGELAGAALRTPPHGLVCSAVPVPAAGELAAALVTLDPGLPGFTGPVETVDALVAASGRRVVGSMAMRLFALDRPRPPDGVPGAVRSMRDDDAALVTARTQAFLTETGGPGDADEAVARWRRGGSAVVAWEDGGEVVSLAVCSAPVAGMSRVVLVHTPPEFRGRGYAAAATTAATRAALAAGAQDVVLFTDLANAVTNRLYPRLGYVAVSDHRDVRLAPTNLALLGSLPDLGIDQADVLDDLDGERRTR